MAAAGASAANLDQSVFDFKTGESCVYMEVPDANMPQPPPIINGESNREYWNRYENMIDDKLNHIRNVLKINPGIRQLDLGTVRQKDESYYDFWVRYYKIVVDEAFKEANKPFNKARIGTRICFKEDGSFKKDRKKDGKKDGKNEIGIIQSFEQDNYLLITNVLDRKGTIHKLFDTRYMVPSFGIIKKTPLQGLKQLARKGGLPSGVEGLIGSFLGASAAPVAANANTNTVPPNERIRLRTLAREDDPTNPGALRIVKDPLNSGANVLNNNTIRIGSAPLHIPRSGNSTKPFSATLFPKTGTLTHINANTPAALQVPGLSVSNEAERIRRNIQANAENRLGGFRRKTFRRKNRKQTRRKRTRS